MLQAIRSKASSLVVKLLFGVLVISFGVWGIGDIFRSRGSDTTVATVGSRKIDAPELNQAIRQDVERLRSMFRGATLDPEQLKQFGVVDSALQRLINRDLMDLEARRLGLAVGDDVVLKAIQSNRAFYNEAGVFDRGLYNRVLAANHITEQQYWAQLRDEITRNDLGHAVIDGATPPPTLVDTLFQSRDERRVAEIAAVPRSAVPDPGTPSDQDLAAYYDQHQDAFRTPELRSFSVGLLQPDTIAAGITVPEDRLREEYQARLDDFHTPEERHIEQMLLPTEDKAKEAEAQLAAGKDFVQVAKDVADAAPDAIDLSFVKRDELPSKLGDVAFALKQGEASQPVQTNYGWHILRVTEIKPEETQPFEAVKDKLAADVARDMAGDQIAKMANQIDDAFAGGAGFADVAQRFDLKVAKIAGVDNTGHDAAGQAVELPQPSADILRTAFSTAAGQTSQLTETQDNGYFVVQVDQVTPSTVKPLEEVRATATELWQTDQRNAALEKLAQSVADEVNGGKPLAEVAAAHKLSVTTSQPLARSGGDAQVPPALVAKIFGAKAGGAVFARGGDGFAVAQVSAVLPPDPAKQADAVAQLSHQLGPQIQDDMLQELDQALRARFPVTINSAAVERAF